MAGDDQLFGLDGNDRLTGDDSSLNNDNLLGGGGIDSIINAELGVSPHPRDFAPLSGRVTDRVSGYVLSTLLSHSLYPG